MMYRGRAQALPLRDGSVHCIVTSPPYNTDQPYPDYDDRLAWNEYADEAWAAAFEMHRVLVPSGRLWLNVQHVVPAVPKRRENKKVWAAGKGREERVNLLQLWTDVCTEVGFRFRDVVAWVQDASDGGAAWGSWLQPSAPNLRGGWEPILLVYKGDRWKRDTPPEFHGWRADQYELEREGEYAGSWMQITRNVWKMQTRRDPYPATFSDELPRRAIRLSTWPSEIVLDPYSGSGTTERVANAMGRIGIGGDL